MRTFFRRPLCVLFSIAFILSCFAFAQDPDEKPRFGRQDDPAAREQWFRKGRQTRNGQPAAKMLHQAYIAKMRLRAQRESQLRSAAASGKPLNSSLAASIGTWTNLGPRPIVQNPSVPDGYGNLAGRVTAVVVDQTDPTGNTVLAAGAYGGVWRSTNAAAADPTIVQWTPLIDNQATLSVGAVSLQPDNSNVILVGTGEPNYGFDSYYGVGILRSTDGGATWSIISNTLDGYQLYGTGVSKFAFSTKNTNVVVADTSFATYYPLANATSLAGTLLSTDAGASWRVIPFTNDNSKFYAASASSVVYNPKQDKFYAVLPYFGVYVSQGTSATGFTSFIRLKNQPGKTGALSTTACPATFSSKCPLLRGALTVRPVLTTNDPDQMFMWFVADGNGDAADDQGIWKSSTDSSGNVTWTSVSDTGITACGDSYGCGTKQSFYNLYLNAVPNGSNTDLYAGTINVYKCSITPGNPTCATTPFINLTHVYGCNGISQVHPDQHAMDFLQSNPAIAYFGNDGGVNRSLSAQTNLNNGTCGNTPNAFDNLNSHLGPLTQFMWGTNHPTDPNTLMGGSQDNGTMAISPSLAAPGDAGWWSVNGGDGGYNWIDPVTPTNWYSAYTGVSIQQCTGGINCNTNSFLPIVEEDLSSGNTHQVNGDDSNFYTPYILDPAKPSQIIVGTCRVWRGGNTAASWPNSSITNVISHKLGTTFDSVCNPADDPIQSIAAGGPANANGSSVIYVGTSGGRVYMTSNANTGIATWTDITDITNPDRFPISSIAIDTSDSTGMTAYLGIQGFTSSGFRHLWSTSNGGVSWFDTMASLPNAPVNDLIVDPDWPSTVYVATDAGVFRWNGNSQEIGPPTPGGSGYLPNVAVLHLALYENGRDKRLRAFTHGRGAWETPLTIPDLTITPHWLNLTASVGTSTTGTMTILNRSTGSITIMSLTMDQQRTQFALIPSETTCGGALAAGASCNVAVQFSPTAVGSFSVGISLTTSSSEFSVFQLVVAGTVPSNATDFAFDLGSNPTSATIKAGDTAAFSFNLDGSPSGATSFNPPITIACSGLPSKSTCLFSSASLSTPGAVSLSIQTTAATTGSSRPLSFPGHTGILTAFGLPGLGLLATLLCEGSQRRRLLMYSSFILVFACLLGATACGGGSSISNPNPPTPPPTTVPGTPAGTYSVVVTGTYGSTTHTQTLTLTVQ